MMDNPSVLDYPKYMEMLGPKLLRPILDSLDAKLQARGESGELTVCGGGALLILNVIDRQTRDIDVITPELDDLLKMVAAEVGQEFGLEPGWLNNGPAPLSLRTWVLARDASAYWPARVEKCLEKLITRLTHAKS